jgi:hypothetical protein
MFKIVHMIRTGLLVGVLILGINLCFGQIYWTKSYDNEVKPEAMQPTKDGNYIIAGYTYPDPPNRCTGWFAKIKPNGDTLWTKTLGESKYSEFHAIESIDGEIFLLIGECSSVSLDYGNGWVAKVNTNGETIWTKTYEKRGEYTNFRAIQKCTDGNFLIAGLSNINGESYSGSILVKITPDGDTLWTRSSGGILLSIQASSDGNYLVAGQNQNVVTNEDEIILLKINNEGRILWTRNYSDSMSQMVYEICPAGNGDYLLLGQRIGDALLMKITPEGDTIWSRTYSTPNSEGYFTGVISTMDGGFLILGDRLTVTGFNQWLLKINKMGDTLWTSTTNGYDYDTYSNIITAGNGTFLALGTALSKWVISCMVEDQYAKKDSLFTFKIPTRGLDSLNCGYKPLKVPSGMSVSAGGTVSWTPHTDSSYLENARFVVVDDQGRKDTLSLNIFVNIENKPSHIRAKHRIQQDKVQSVFTVTSHLERGNVQFNFPASGALLSIYDMSGRLVDRINPVNSTGRQTILWPAGGTGYHSGQYIARVVTGKKTEAKVFMLGR